MTDTIVVAPHPDDEVLGAAEVLAGGPTTVVHVTDGVPPWVTGADREAMRDQRREESRAAWAELPARVETAVSMGYGDLTAWRNIAGIADRLCELVASGEGARLYVPAYQRGHPDHDATYVAAHLARRRMMGRADVEWVVYGLYGFDHDHVERFSWLTPTYYNGAEVRGASGADLERKAAALRRHRSQVRTDSVVQRWLDRPQPEAFSPLPATSIPLPDLDCYYDEVFDFASRGVSTAGAEAVVRQALAEAAAG